jgi:hypothetical protein
MWKRYLLVFVVAFLLNLIWENLHSVLYVHYQGGPITETILLRASLFDAVFITILLFLIRNIKSRGIELYLLLSVSFLVAIAIELFALATGRWAYSPTMSIVPVLGVGLSPIIQLPFLGWFTKKLLKF